MQASDGASHGRVTAALGYLDSATYRRSLRDAPSCDKNKMVHL